LEYLDRKMAETEISLIVGLEVAEMKRRGFSGIRWYPDIIPCFERLISGRGGQK
jgi:hypothetical protein